MKFSVLIPTRNRLELLEYAVATVLRQDYSDWELVVADNDSAQDVAGYVQKLGDPRIRYFRTRSFLPVTDNWNYALAQSSGDYVIMLGDDDALLKGYFTRQAALIEQFSAPDFIYTDALQYAYPGVMPDHEEGLLQIGYTAFIGGAREPFMLPRADALEAVRNSMRFRVTFGFNMQHFLVARAQISALASAGEFFQSPYPDYYAANALFLTAGRALIVPRPMVAIGISSKSFGFYYFNRREDEGVSFLNNADTDTSGIDIAQTLLPGSAMNTSWLIAMEILQRNFPAQSTFPVARRRYRLLQIISIWRNQGWRGLARLLRRLTPKELLVLPLLAAALAVVRLLPGRPGSALYERLVQALGAYPRFDHRRKSVPYRNILEVFENVDPDYY